MTEPLRIGVIGAGANTRRMHLPGFAKIPGVETVVVCNRSEESSRRVAGEFDIPRIAAAWREVVKDPDVDAVMIGTWPYLHAEATIAALGEGKHVLTEARMARDLAEAEAMLEASRKKPDLVAQIVPAPMSLDFDSTIVELLENGEIGELREVCVTHTARQYVDPDAPLTWRQDFELSGCNVLSMGIYHEMVQRWIPGEPEWLVADAAVFVPRRPSPEKGGEVAEVKIPDDVSVLGRWNGARMVYHFSGVESGKPRNEIRLNGSKASLRLDFTSGTLFLGRGGEEEEIKIPEEKRRGWRVEEDFAESIRSGKPVELTSFETGVRYMRFTQNVHQSWTDGARKVAFGA